MKRIVLMTAVFFSNCYAAQDLKDEYRIIQTIPEENSFEYRPTESSDYSIRTFIPESDKNQLCVGVFKKGWSVYRIARDQETRQFISDFCSASGLKPHEKELARQYALDGIKLFDEYAAGDTKEKYALIEKYDAQSRPALIFQPIKDGRYTIQAQRNHEHVLVYVLENDTLVYGISQHGYWKTIEEHCHQQPSGILRKYAIDCLKLFRQHIHGTHVLEEQTLTNVKKAH